MGRTRWLKVISHGHRKHHAVSPLRHDARCAFDGIGIQGGRGCDVFKHIANQTGVAINVCTDLHKGCATVPTGQGHHIGFGHVHGNVHALPCEVFVAQDEPNFFGKGRQRVMVQQDIGHDASF